MQVLQGIHIYDKFISCEKYKRLDRTTLGVICLTLKKFKSKKIERQKTKKKIKKFVFHKIIGQCLN
jgi:23S rRNA-/tRNA-specific pseudouridylate synthase